MTQLLFAKALTEQPVTNDAAMSARFCIASQREDREDDILQMKGCDWSDHQRNPVVLLDHDPKQIIGKSESPDGAYTVERVGDRLYATAYYQQDNQLGVQTYALVKGGFLRGASVGFTVKKSTPRGKGSNGRRSPLLISEWQLFEWSNTALPMNPDAVRETLSRDIDGHPLHETLRKALEPFALLESEKIVSGWEPTEENVRKIVKECVAEWQNKMMPPPIIPDDDPGDTDDTIDEPVVVAPPLELKRLESIAAQDAEATAMEQANAASLVKLQTILRRSCRK